MEKLLVDLPDELRTERLVIRPYHPGEGALLFEAVSASRDHLFPWMPWARKEGSVEESELLVRRIWANWWTREDLTMAIFDASESRVLGGTGFHRIDWEVKSFEIGYWIRPNEEGKGLISESTRALCDFAFHRLSARRVHIRCSTTNFRSMKVPRGLGFKEEGIFLNSGLLGDGSVTDIVSFGMTPEIWFSRHPGPAL